MANARALDKRRKSIGNIRKITRTMELIATARYKKAMDRAAAVTAYTDRLAGIVSSLASSGTEVAHPLLEARENPTRARVLVLSSNRGLCGGYNGAILRSSAERIAEMRKDLDVTVDVSGKRGMNGLAFRGIQTDRQHMGFEDQPAYEEVEKIASEYLEDYIAGRIDRLDVIYTRFISTSRQAVTIETLLPLGSLAEQEDSVVGGGGRDDASNKDYEFLPSAESILEEIVPTSFKAKLFKYFLDAAVSEQVARMIAMKGATESAGDMIKELSMTYNRARQSQITGEIMEIIGGVEALGG